MAQVSEHDWEKLYVLKEWTGVPTYADLDRCSKCGALRRIMPDSVIYKSKDWDYNTLEEPPCVEEKA